MNETLKTEKNIREYLLGRVTDDAKLAEYEELLFSDDEFCELAEVVEDALVNDFVFGRLSADDESDFVQTIENNSDRRSKVALTRALKVKAAEQSDAAIEPQVSFFDSIKAFFRQPIYAGGFALLLIALLIGSLIVFRSTPDELANLKDIYKTERPVEPRIAGFDYAPLVVTRGAVEEKNKNKLELEKTRFLQAVVEDPTAVNFHKLGVFYLTQQNYKDAIENLEKAVKLDDKNAKFHNDLGSAYFEFAKQGKDDRLLNFSRANEAFATALKINGDSLEALFNRSLVLQEMGLRNQATESWNLYLQKDSTSKWADEARKNLEKIKQIESGSTKTKEQILEDFLTAYRNQNWQFAEKIHNSTKGMLNGISPFEQLTRRYLDARKARDALIATESLDAMNYIGNLEKEKHADFFYAELADYYSKIDDRQIDNLLKAKDLLIDGRKLLYATKYSESLKAFKQSKNCFVHGNDSIESYVSEIWISQMLHSVGKTDEGIKRLNSLAAIAEKKNYMVILTSAFDWLANAEYRKNNLSRAISTFKKSLQVAEKSVNLYEISQNGQSLTSCFLDLRSFDEASEFIERTHHVSDVYYQNTTQIWRRTLYMTEIAREQRNLISSIDFGRECYAITLEKMPNQIQAISNVIRELTRTLIATKEFNEAQKIADDAVERAERLETSGEKDLILADAYLHRGNVFRESNNCELAILDYESSLGFLSSIPNTTYNLYNIHLGKLSCFQTLGQQTDFNAELETVLNLSEQNRQNIKEDELRQLFFDSQQFVYNAAISNSLGKNEKEKAFEYAEISKARSLLEFVKSKKSIAEVERDFGSVAKPLTLAEIQKSIPENVQIVEYALLNDKLSIWTITKNRFELSEKQIEIESLAQKITEYRTAVTDNNDAELVKNLATELYEILLPQDLDNGKTLCLIPDKSLHQLPFASLISPTGKYLIEDHELVYSPSASVFVIASENAQMKERVNENLLSVGNPEFDTTENTKLKNLPEAEIEAARIADNYSSSEIFLGSKATKSAFLANLQRSSVVHYAGHFVANERSSGNSKMLFADDYLRVFELADQKILKSKLVVLSACETGFERVNKSEGAIGIARTFLAMGTPIVVASSWKVDSESTKDLMIAFHKNRRVSKLSTVAALRQAQIEMLRSANFSSPYYWAAFSATGGLTNY